MSLFRVYQARLRLLLLAPAAQYVELGNGCQIVNGRLAKLSGSTGWSGGSYAPVMIPVLAVGEVATIRYETPRDDVGEDGSGLTNSAQVFGLTFQDFVQSGFAYIDYSWYFDPTAWLVIEGGNYKANDNRSATSTTPTIQVTGVSVNGALQYRIDYLLGGSSTPVRSVTTTTTPTKPLRIVTTLYQPNNGSNMSESPAYTLTSRTVPYAA